MKKAKRNRNRAFSNVRKCRFCGYFGGGWKDDDQCPSCGEVN